LGSTINSWQLYEIKIITTYQDIVFNADSIYKYFKPEKDINEFKLNNGYVQITTAGADAFIISKFSLTNLFSSVKKTNPNQWRNILISLGIFILLVLFFYFTQKKSTVKISGKEILQKIFIVCFLICISVPTLFMFMPGTYHEKETENTEKPEKPQFQVKDVSKFIKEYHAYFEKSFAYRNELITLNSFIQYKLFKASSQPQKVLVGGNNWLYPTEEGIVDDVKKMHPFKPSELNAIINNLKNLQQQCDSLHIKLYITVLPNKYTIYPENLPNRFHVSKEISRREQVTESLTSIGINIIDPTNELLKAKKNTEVFYRYDTHWNYQGGFIGYLKLIQTIQKDFPQIRPLNSNDFENKYKISYNGDLAKLIGMGNILPNNEWLMIPKNGKTFYDGKVTEYISYNSPYKAVYQETADTSMPTALIFRDSYANMLVPFISENFSRSVFLWTNVVLKEAVKKENPDVIILEVVEDKLHLYIDQQAF